MIDFQDRVLVLTGAADDFSMPGRGWCRGI